jgi:DeoR family fructose operon transcriptional repressor
VHGNLATEERLDWLKRQLGETGTVALAQAAEVLGVSEMTIRRDLAELEERGIARRVRGGATAAGPQLFVDRHRAGARAKARIAQKLSLLLPSEGVVAFDASSTVMRLASAVDGARDLTVLTNSPETFGALQGRKGVVAELTGGRIDPRTGSLVGPIACRSASQLLVSVFFTSAAAVDPVSGALEATLEEAEVKRTIAANAGSVVLAVHGSKLGTRAVAVGLEWEAVDTLVTDLDPGDQRLAPYRARARIL